MSFTKNDSTIKDITKSLMTENGAIIINFKRGDEIFNNIFRSFEKLKKHNKSNKKKKVVIVCSYDLITKWKKKVSLYSMKNWDFVITDYKTFTSIENSFFDKEKVNYLVLFEGSLILKYLTNPDISQKIYEKCFLYEKKLIVNNSFFDTKITDVVIFINILTNKIKHSSSTKLFRENFEVEYVSFNILFYPIYFVFSSFFYVLCILFLIINIYLFDKNLNIFLIKLSWEYMKNKNITEENVIDKSLDSASKKNLVFFFRELFFKNNIKKIKAFFKNLQEQREIDTNHLIDEELIDIHELKWYNPFNIFLYWLYTEVLAPFLYKSIYDVLFSIFKSIVRYNDSQDNILKKNIERGEELSKLFLEADEQLDEFIRASFSSRQNKYVENFIFNLLYDNIFKEYVFGKKEEIKNLSKDLKSFLDKNKDILTKENLLEILKMLKHYNYDENIEKIFTRKFKKKEKKIIWDFVILPNSTALNTDMFLLQTEIFKTNTPISLLFKDFTNEIFKFIFTEIHLKKLIDFIILFYLYNINNLKYSSTIDYIQLINISKNKTFFKYSTRVLIGYAAIVFNSFVIVIILATVYISQYLLKILRQKVYKLDQDIIRNLDYKKFVEYIQKYVVVIFDKEITNAPHIRVVYHAYTFYQNTIFNHLLNGLLTKEEGLMLDIYNEDNYAIKHDSVFNKNILNKHGLKIGNLIKPSENLHIINKNHKYQFSNDTSNISINNKFKYILNNINFNKDKKVCIYSSYKNPGGKLLSAVLSSYKINHIYLEKNNLKMLEYFNKGRINVIILHPNHCFGLSIRSDYFHILEPIKNATILRKINLMFPPNCISFLHLSRNNFLSNLWPRIYIYFLDLFNEREVRYSLGTINNVPDINTHKKSILIEKENEKIAYLFYEKKKYAETNAHHR